VKRAVFMRMFFFFVIDSGFFLTQSVPTHAENYTQASLENAAKASKL